MLLMFSRNFHTVIMVVGISVLECLQQKKNYGLEDPAFLENLEEEADAAWQHLLLFVFIIITTCHPSHGYWPTPSYRIIPGHQEGAATCFSHLDVMLSNVQAWPSMR